MTTKRGNRSSEPVGQRVGPTVLESAAPSVQALHHRLQHEKHAIQKTPHEQLRLDVVPKGDESEHHKHVPSSARLGSPEGHVYVAHEPLVEAAVPAFPEAHDGVVVGHAFLHMPISDARQARQSAGKGM